MTDQNQAVEPEVVEAPEAKAPAKPKVDIIRGRMPVAMVYTVRFGKLAEGGAQCQRLFATTVGKIYDIEKGRNFAYVTEEVQFTQAQIDEGIEWIGHHPMFDEEGAQVVVDYLKALPVADEAAAAKFEEIRKAARGQSTTTKEGEKAEAGGGNRRSKSKSKKEVEADSDAEAAEAVEASADDLLG